MTAEAKPLTETQQELVDRCKRVHRRYMTLMQASDKASDRLTALIRRAADAGVTRYRIGQELGMTTQSVDGRVAYVKTGRNAPGVRTRRKSAT